MAYFYATMASKQRNKNGLLDREQVFADHYLSTNCVNGEQSAIYAGYPAKSAKSRASQLLTNLNLQRYLQLKREQISNKLEITIQSVLQGISRMANFDPRNLYHPDGSPKAIHELDDDTALALESWDIENVTTGTGKNKTVKINSKIKPNSRERALEMLAKYLKLYTDAPPPNPVNIHAKTVVFK